MNLRQIVLAMSLTLLCLAALGVQAGEPLQTSPPHAQLLLQEHPPRADDSPMAVPEPSAKSLHHYREGLALISATIAWMLLVPALAVFTGYSARLRSWAQQVSRRWYVTFALFVLAYGLIYFLASLPLSYYAGFVHPHHYGLSNQTLGRWLAQYAKVAGVVMAVVLTTSWFPLVVIRKSPRRWWLYLGLLALPSLCTLAWVEPWVIAPLFHPIQHLQNSALESKIVAEAERCGIEGSRVYEVKMSEDTKTLNAYMTGFGQSKRIVFWDTTLKALNEGELLFIMGHEMGHYVLGHLLKHIAFGSALIVVLLFIVHWLGERLLAKCHARVGFNSLSDIAALPLILLLVLIVGLAGLPIPMAFSRHLEHEADRFGLELTHNNHAAATAFVKLRAYNLGISRPGVIVKLWLFTHPPVAERIEFCNTYRPWETDIQK
jgi:Zn-dependent protease with chaperone function